MNSDTEIGRRTIRFPIFLEHQNDVIDNMNAHLTRHLAYWISFECTVQVNNIIDEHIHKWMNIMKNLPAISRLNLH
jgi:hypothetical protein